MFHRMDMPDFVFPVINWQYRQQFYFGAFMNNTAVHVCVQVFVWMYFHFSWVYI